MNCSSTSEVTDSAFVQVAARISKQIANDGYQYTSGSVAIPPSDKKINCSAFVNWVLYEYGFKDEFGSNTMIRFHLLVLIGRQKWDGKSLVWQLAKMLLQNYEQQI